MGIGSIQGINDTIKLCNALEWCTRERSHETTLLSCFIGSDGFSNLPRRLKPDIFCMRFYLTRICVDGAKQCFRQYSNLRDWEAISQFGAATLKDLSPNSKNSKILKIYPWKILAYYRVS